MATERRERVRLRIRAGDNDAKKRAMVVRPQ